jgi:hypothetical protein
MHTTTCPECNGSRWIECEYCKGSGDNHLAIEKYKGEITIEPGVCNQCRGNKGHTCRECNNGFAHPPEPLRSIQVMVLHHDWIQIVREAADKQNKTEKPTKRLVTAIKKLINNPDVGVSWNPDNYGYYEITMWISSPINEYEDRLTISWSKGGVDGYAAWIQKLPVDHPSWVSLEEELQRYDQADVLDRIEIERRAYSTFNEIDGQIANLEEQIAALRLDATNVLKELPEPESATVRKGSFFAKEPTVWARTTFPHIWPASK